VVGVRYKSKKIYLYCISDGKDREVSWNETEVSKKIFLERQKNF